MESRLSKKRLPNNASFYTVESRGKPLALDMVHQSMSSQLVILSDSVIFAKSSKSRLLTPSLAWFLSGGTSIIFVWVPSHVGLAGNLVADTAAKAALLLPVSNLSVTSSDYNSLICTQALTQSAFSNSAESARIIPSAQITVRLFTRIDPCAFGNDRSD